MQELINDLEGLVDRSKHVPASGKLLVDEATLRQIIGEMRSAVPDDARIRQRIAGERERILLDARAQAQRLMDEAQGLISGRLDERAETQLARERAKQIMAEAEREGGRVRREASDYVITQFAALDSRLQRMLREIQAGMQFLTQGNEGRAADGATKPESPARADAPGQASPAAPRASPVPAAGQTQARKPGSRQDETPVRGPQADRADRSSESAR